MTELVFSVKELYWSKKVCLEHFILTHHSVHDESCNGNHDNYKSHFFQAPGDDWTKAKGKKWVGRRASAEKVLCPGLQVDRGAGPSAVVVLGGRPGPRWHRLQSTQLGSTPHLNPAQLQLQPTTTEEKQTRALCCRLSPAWKTSTQHTLLQN